MVSTNVLYPVLEKKQPRKAKLPIVAGSWMGTMLSVGEGNDETDLVTEMEPTSEEEETEVKSGFDGKITTGGVMVMLAPVGYGTVGTKVVAELVKEVEVSSSDVVAVVAPKE